MIVVLVVAAGAAWESAAMRLLAADPGIVVLKRCVDVDDLLATAAAGQADVAILGLDAPGLDPAAVEHLRRHAVRPVAVVAGSVRPGDPVVDSLRLRAGRLAITSLVSEDDLDVLPAAVVAAAREDAAAPRPGGHTADLDPDGTVLDASLPPDLAAGAAAGSARSATSRGRVVVVWGPPGAPGRSTVACAIAAELSRRQRRTILIDADAHAPSLAQQLGITDEVSGMLAAARLALGGQLDEHLASVQRGLSRHLSVVTGLPRPDRWSEIRPDTVEALLHAARELGEVVVDTGAPLEPDATAEFGTRPPRNTMTLEAIGAADEVVVVGAADPVGLARLARGLVELREAVPGVPLRVVVNRMRPSLGWSETDVATMVAGFARPVTLHFLPEDQAAADRALVTGRTLLESGGGPLSAAIVPVVDALAPGPVPGSGGATVSGASSPGGLRRRRAGRARPR